MTCFMTNNVLSAMSLRSVDFKVFGKVQRVFFRKCTKEMADSLGVVGWCKNLPDSTVTGN